MSRSGYVDDWDDSDYPAALYRGSVTRAIQGRRGQRFFRELIEALDAMPDKRLEAEVFDEGHDGPACALGALARHKGKDITHLDPEDSSAAEELAHAFDIASCLARETIYINDEGDWARTIWLVHGDEHGERRAYVTETPDQRWARVRAWAANQLKNENKLEQETPTP